MAPATASVVAVRSRRVLGLANRRSRPTLENGAKSRVWLPELDSNPGTCGLTGLLARRRAPFRVGGHDSSLPANVR